MQDADYRRFNSRTQICPRSIFFSIPELYETIPSFRHSPKYPRTALHVLLISNHGRTWYN